MNYLDQFFNIKGKVAVITGATGQLGSVACEVLSKAGMTVIGIDSNIGDNRINGVEYLKADIRLKHEVMQSIEYVASKYQHLDICINNAGVSTFEPFEERPEEKIDWVMDVNLKGTFFCIQCYVNVFDKLKYQQGSIINIASHYGVVSPDFRIYTDCNRQNSEIYGATKAGIIQMTKYFSVHLAGRNIRVNAVSPGGIYNPKNPQGSDFIKNYSYRCPMNRMGNDSEIMGALLYLASDAASYTTGQNITIDGGFTSW